MLLVRPCALFAPAIACAICGCSSERAAPSPLPTPTFDAAPEADAPTATSVAFELTDVVTLSPGETRELPVVVEPPGVHSVRFALGGDFLDATLDTGVRSTGSDGKTQVKLTAPQVATTFSVRAVADNGPIAEAAVSVSGEGFGSVEVVPHYEGHRNALIWVATARAGAKCTDLAGIPPPDGPVVVHSQLGKTLVLNGLPVGPNLAITARWEQAVGGCVDVSNLTVGGQKTVTINASDRPVDLSSTDLNFTATLGPDAQVVLAALAPVVVQFLDVIAPDGTENTRLLDAMEAVSPDPLEFQEARAQNDWDAIAAAQLSSGSSLRDRLNQWIGAGLQPLQDGAAFSGALHGKSASAGALELLTLGGLDVAATGSPLDDAVSLSASSGDIIHVGGTIYVAPTGFIAAAGDYGATEAQLGSAIAAIKQTVGCTTLATKLYSVGQPPASCDGDCLSELCTEAIELLWDQARALSTSTFQIAALQFVVSAQAEVNGEARIEQLKGAWTGSYTSAGSSLGVKGGAEGTAAK